MDDLRNGALYIGGCKATELAETYGTPLYVYDKSVIESHIAQLRRDFLDKWPGARVAYAAKAFCTLGMCQLVKEAGLCIDVVSGGELYTALQAGVPGERIELNGNNKLKSELELAIANDVGRIIVDGFHEVETIQEISARLGKRTRVLFRITPGIQADSHDYIITGKKDSKFGFPLDEDLLYPAIAQAIKAPNVDFLGFHFHIGSQLFENRAYLEATDVILNLCQVVKERFGHEVTELNLGGGFGIQYTDEERKPYSYFLEGPMERIRDRFTQMGLPLPALVIEPGRSLVGDAGVTLYTVGEVKDIPGLRTYVSVDGGMADNIRPALYQAQYRAMLANRAQEETDAVVTLCGKCCESGDILVKDAHLPSPRTGDTLAVFSTGAYCFSMASNYNCSPVPAVVVVQNGTHKLWVRRQSYDDLLKNQVL